MFIKFEKKTTLLMDTPNIKRIKDVIIFSNFLTLLK